MARSVEQGFVELVRRLQPLHSEHDKAQKHHKTIKSCLESNFGCYNLFETGSFGNGTGVRGYSDTDYFAVCPSAKLWEDSGYTLIRFREELDYTFWSTAGIRVNNPAVQIPFGTVASETIEVTPATFSQVKTTPVGQKAFYKIPGNDGDWINSSPDAHNAYVNQENKRLDLELKPLIQLVKAWKYYNNVPITSFYLELRTTKYTESEGTIIYSIDVERILRNLLDNELAAMRDPMDISGLVPACKTAAMKERALAKLELAVRRAEKAAIALSSGNADETFRLWDLVFAGNFPAR